MGPDEVTQEDLGELPEDFEFGDDDGNEDVDAPAD